MPAVTVVLPCLGRPIRTRRAIESVLDQSCNDWQLFVEGDGCQEIQKIMDCGEYKDHRITMLNYWPCRRDPSPLITHMIDNAAGKYILFLGNDDFFLPDHIQVRLNGIRDTEYDFMYAPSIVNVQEGRFIRKPILKSGEIGHSELIVRTDFARKVPHEKEYGHDWRFIQGMIEKGAKHKEMLVPPTIVVAHVCGYHSLEKFD